MMATMVVDVPKWWRYQHDEITPEMRQIAERVGEALALMADFTPDEVAEYLQSQGITGLRGNSQKCPIAVWLQSVTGYGQIRVAWNVAIWFDGVIAKYETPPVLRNFYHAFDSMQYPDLLAVER
jgi:hypothetical protein